MPGTIALDLPEEKIKLVTGNVPLSAVIPMPVQVAANQVIGVYLDEGESAPQKYQLTAKWNLPAGKSARDICGEGLTVNSDKPPSIISVKSGYLVVVENKMKVTGIYEVLGNLTNRLLNIDTPGSVLVHGEVGNGVEIVSGGNVEIRGLVENASIRAKGSIVAKGGVVGGESGRLVAGQDIYSQYFQQAAVEAAGNIVVDGSIINSTVMCGKKLVIRKNGFLVGGKTFSHEGIEVQRVGSEGALLTEVELGCNPFQKVQEDRIKEQLDSLRKDMATVETSIKHIENQLGGIVRYDATDRYSSLFNSAEVMQSRMQSFTVDETIQMHRYGSGIMRCIRMEREIILLERELETLKGEKAFNPKARLKVEKIAHPGTVIRIHGSSMRLDMEYEKATFWYKPETGEILVSYQ